MFFGTSGKIYDSLNILQTDMVAKTNKTYYTFTHLCAVTGLSYHI